MTIIYEGFQRVSFFTSYW